MMWSIPHLFNSNNSLILVIQQYKFTARIFRSFFNIYIIVALQSLSTGNIGHCILESKMPISIFFHLSHFVQWIFYFSLPFLLITVHRFCSRAAPFFGLSINCYNFLCYRIGTRYLFLVWHFNCSFLRWCRQSIKLFPIFVIQTTEE